MEPMNPKSWINPMVCAQRFGGSIWYWIQEPDLPWPTSTITSVSEHGDAWEFECVNFDDFHMDRVLYDLLYSAACFICLSGLQQLCGNDKVTRCRKPSWLVFGMRCSHLDEIWCILWFHQTWLAGKSPNWMEVLWKENHWFLWSMASVARHGADDTKEGIHPIRCH